MISRERQLFVLGMLLAFSPLGIEQSRESLIEPMTESKQ
jgi:hypothetical protein